MNMIMVLAVLAAMVVANRASVSVHLLKADGVCGPLRFGLQLLANSLTLGGLMYHCGY